METSKRQITSKYGTRPAYDRHHVKLEYLHLVLKGLLGTGMKSLRCALWMPTA